MKTNLKAVILDKSTLGSIAIPKELLDLAQWEFFDQTDSQDVRERIQDVDIVFTNKVVLNKEQLEGSRVRYIGVLATGTNNIDLNYCADNNIAVKNAVGYSTDSVAQHTFSMLLSFISKSHYFDEFVKDSSYSNSPIFTHFGFEYSEIKGKTWGILGMGAIGRKVAEIATAFGVIVVYYSTSGEDREAKFQRLSLEDFVEQSDIISIHAPMNDKTNRLVDYQFMSNMKPNAILLNLGRGGIIVEDDLIKVLNENRIAGVCLDVFESEPFDFVSKYKELTDKNKLLLSPHIAWASEEAREKLLDISLENLKTWLKN